MMCNIIELGGIINNNFSRNYYTTYENIDNDLKKFTGDKYMTIYSYENTNVDTCNFIAPFYLDLDIDNIEENYDKLVRDLKIIYRQLKIMLGLKEENIEIYFSGSKGFHIIIDQNIFGFKPNRTLNKDFKKIALHLKSYTITKCIDTKIYDYRRLFRINNTINSKTGLYKVYINYNNLVNLSFDELKEYASSPKEIEDRDYNFNKEANEKFFKLIEEIDKKEKQKINMKVAHEFLVKKELLPCVKYILQNGAVVGYRNNTTVALANSLFQIGNSLEEVREIIYKWNDYKNDTPLSKQELDVTIASAYRNSNQDIFYGCSSFRDLNVCVKDCPIYK